MGKGDHRQDGRPAMNICAAVAEFAAVRPVPTGPPLPVGELDRLRAVRSAVRADTGTLWPDPRDGAPMVGTGHCHDVCMEAETAECGMAGGWFRHPDGYDYEHSWLVGSDGVIVDPTFDQWHLDGHCDVETAAPGSALAGRYVTGSIVLDEDGYLADGDVTYDPPDGFEPVAPPADPALRGLAR